MLCIEYNIITGRKSVKKASSSSTSNIFATASTSYTITYYRFQKPSQLSRSGKIERSHVNSFIMPVFTLINLSRILGLNSHHKNNKLYKINK